MNWRDLYGRARAHGDTAAGYYNDNIRVDTPNGPVIVRIPIHDADMMDLPSLARRPRPRRHRPARP